jgi:pimeloyl-ACP methyl ester carboxylesterase
LRFIYLHGFASTPDSAKAVYLREAFAAYKISLEVPDLNQDDFSHLTIARQIAQVESLFPSDGTPVTLIGSSLGGLTSAWLAEKHAQVHRLVLLAPAFGFLDHWLPQLEEEQLRQWQTSGYLPIYHYGEKRSLPLHYQFVEDARQYQEMQLLRPVPTLILHGRHDEVIPLAASQAYASMRPWVQLIELDSDHGLRDVLPQIWEATQGFCQLC